MFRRKAWFFAALLLCTSGLSAQDNFSLSDNTIREQPTNVKLRLQLDKTVIHACEPVYICVTADKFATKIDQNIRVTCKGQEPVDLGSMDKQWLHSDLTKSPVRMTILLSQIGEGESARYLFEKPGQYEIRVKIGPDVTPLTVRVEAGTPEDEQAFSELGAKNFTALLTEEVADPAPRELLETCQAIARKFPDSLAASYCRSYEAIALFKQNALAHERSGGPAVWSPVALQLQKVFAEHKDDFFGEKVGFYLAYAQGLSGDLAALTRTADQVKTHFSPWGDRIYLMKMEVAAHLVKPKVMTTQPSPGH